MAGLTVRQAEGVINTGRTLDQRRIMDMKPSKVEGKSFADTMSDAITDVNELQKNADTLGQKLATGEVKNIPEVMVAMEKADIAMKLMVKVRNKVIDAYQEIMKMQV